MDPTIDFGELSTDENLKTKITEFRKDLNKSSDMLKTFYEKFNYEELQVEDKVRYNLFQAFAINSLYWMYLRTKGQDPAQHEIKSQINRVKDYMNKSKQIYERKTIMPRLDQGAAKRFVKSGLWTPKETKQQTSSDNQKKTLKRKRED